MNNKFKSDFKWNSRGVIGNFIQFFECSCFGCFQLHRIDWSKKFQHNLLPEETDMHWDV